VAVSYTEPDAAPATVQIETANALQLKYAVVMDVTVEMLTNMALLQAIDRWWGTKYCLGGITDSCIDCSGFTQNIMRDVYRQNLPRTAQEQFNLAQKIELEDMKEGDLVFFNTVGKDISHVGVYLMNNKFVHASTSGGVTISDLNDTYWQPKFRGVGRIRE
jgi:cell wall-associated NlpC family hydrolase